MATFVDIPCDAPSSYTIYYLCVRSLSDNSTDYAVTSNIVLRTRWSHSFQLIDNAILRIIDCKKCKRRERKSIRLTTNGMCWGTVIKSVALEALLCGQSASKRNVTERIRRSPVEITRQNDSQMLTRDARSKAFSAVRRRRLCALKTVRLNVHFAAISKCTRCAILD